MVAKATIIAREVPQNFYNQLLGEGIEPLFARIYAARGIASRDEIDYSLQKLLPFDSMKNIHAVAERIARAIASQEKILIVADYDADGATACALGVLGLREFGATVDFLVPNRFEHGYGICPAIVDEAAKLGAQIIITVDNGIAAHQAVKHAKRRGLDIIVTDHHLPGDTLPDCLIVNPNQPGCPFPSKSLAGVGVMFYVLCALRSHLRNNGHYLQKSPPNLAQWLDLVALGTVADVVQLDYNNRILLEQGLRRIRAGSLQAGVKALFDIAHRDYKKAKSFDLGFALGPRINAAGRLDDMSVGIACLLSTNDTEAADFAEGLDALNRQRRSIEQSITEEALNLSETLSDSQTRAFSTVAYHPNWHQGVIGIVAGRLRERLHRPTIVFAKADNNTLHGSGRSISALHLRDTLDLVDKKHPGLILRFGGHAMAAGLSVPTEKLDAFREAFESTVATLLKPSDLAGVFVTDGNLPGECINLQVAQKIDESVWGQGFDIPSFHGTFEVISTRIVGRKHTKALLKKDGYELPAMLFNHAEPLPSTLHAVYRMVANEWRNRLELQLYIDHFEAV